jgi:hypothetical protein
MPDWMRDAAEPLGVELAKIFDTLETDEEREAFADYLRFLVESGDPLNDFLTHLPEAVRGPLLELGKGIETIMNREMEKTSASIGASVSTASGHAHNDSDQNTASVDTVAANVLTGVRANAEWSSRNDRLLGSLATTIDRNRPPTAFEIAEALTAERAQFGGRTETARRDRLQNGIAATTLTANQIEGNRLREINETYVVNNPVAEETEDSIRRIATRRTYMGANGTEDTEVARTSTRVPKRSTAPPVYSQPSSGPR